MNFVRPGRCLLLVCALPGLAFAQSRLDQQLRAAVERKDVPGLVVIAGNRQGVIYQGTFGLAENSPY